MKYFRTFKGKITSPEEMTNKQLESYIEFLLDYMKWCLDDGLESLFDRLHAQVEIYLQEHEKRSRIDQK